LASKNRATVIGWTGEGNLDQLGASISRALLQAKVKGTVKRSGGSVLVEGPEPAGVTSMFRKMPGVQWIAVGLAASSFKELASASALLAKRYLKRGDRFSVGADVSGGVAEADVGGAVASAALEAVKGARIDEQKPKIRFRATYDGSKGAVGVELSDGPGGAPTGTDGATCLTSGGRHSSVLCWMALLSGYRVRMVHAKVDDGSLKAVARLYAELSHRVDPSGLHLDVLGGGDAAPLLKGYMRGAKGPVFGGFHSTCSGFPVALRGKVGAPLYLLPEESFVREYEGLSLKEYDSELRWGARRDARPKITSFGGIRADINQVLDGLR
jgi:hypothetical protein